MTLSAYHKMYSERSDEEIARRSESKRREISAVFAKMGKPAGGDVAILGCGDRRFVKGYRDIFSSELGTPVSLTVFDVTTEHLEGEEGVVRHDITKRLPGGPYDITLGHVVLKFIPTESHWDVVKNSFDVLKPGGLAIHILGSEELSDPPGVAEWQYRVDLSGLERRLSEAEIAHERWTETFSVGPHTFNVHYLVLKK